MSLVRCLSVAGLLLAVILLPLRSAQAQTNMLSNSSFETWTGGTPALNTAITGFTGTPAVSTVLTGWRLIDGTGSTVPWVDGGASTLTNTNFAQAAAGTRALNFNTDSGVNYLTQNVTLTNGKLYRLAFDERVTGTANTGNMTLAAFISTANSTTPTALQSFTLLASATSTATMSSSWTTQSSTADLLFTQATGTYDLTFAFTGSGTTGKDIAIDRVSLMATPEPGSFVAIGSAVCALLYRRFKKKSRSSTPEAV